MRILGGCSHSNYKSYHVLVISSKVKKLKFILNLLKLEYFEKSKGRKS